MNIVKSLFSPKKDPSSKGGISAKRPSLPGRSSKGPRLSSSSLALAGIKDDIEDGISIANKQNPLSSRKSGFGNSNNSNNTNSRSSNDIDTVDIKVTVKSVSPSLKTNSISNNGSSSSCCNGGSSSKSNQGFNINTSSTLHNSNNNNNNSNVVLKEVTIAGGSAGGELIGLRISVFNPRNQKWSDGIIVSFNADRHRICFDDGSTDDYFLPTTRIKLEEVGANMITSGKLRRTSVIKANNIEAKATKAITSNEMSSIKKLIESRKSISISLENISAVVNDVKINDNNSPSPTTALESPVITAPIHTQGGKDKVESSFNNDSKSLKNNITIPVIEKVTISESNLKTKTKLPFSNNSETDDNDNDEEELSSHVPFQRDIVSLPPPPPQTKSSTDATSTKEIENKGKPEDYMFSLEVNTKKGIEYIYFKDDQDPDKVASDFVVSKGLPKKLALTLGIAIREKHLETLKLVLSSTTANKTESVLREPEPEPSKEVINEISVTSLAPNPVEEWIEASDENGQKYYYNTVSFATSWTNPGGTGDWVEASDENGQKYYYNIVTGASSWTNPNETNEAIEANERNGDSGHWVEASDDNGQTYYYNSATGESSWTNPNETNGDSGDWVEASDESGQTYYYNTVTLATSWSSPKDF